MVVSPDPLAGRVDDEFAVLLGEWSCGPFVEQIQRNLARAAQAHTLGRSCD